MFKIGNNSEYNFPTDNFQLIREKTLRILLAIFLVIATGLLVVNYLHGQTLLVFLTTTFIALFVISFLLLQGGKTLIAQISLPLTLIITIFIVVINGFGLHDAGMFAFAAVIALADLTLGQSGAIAFAVLVILMVLGLGTAEIRDILISETSKLTTWTSVTFSVVLVIVYTVFQELLTLTLRYNKKYILQNEQTQSNANQELRELTNKLKDQINDQNQQLQRSDDQFAAISELTHAAASFQDIGELLKSSINLISKIFSYAQVAIFLLDETGTRIFLQAINGPKGKAKIERGHALSIDSNSIVGNVVKNQTTFSSLISQHDTQPEITVPVMVGRRMIGVLDIQNNQGEDFSQEDIMIASILSDILALGIENTRLMETTRKALIESIQSSQLNIKQAWHQHSKRFDQLEYQYQNGEIRTEQKRGSDQDSNEDTKNSLHIPLFVHGQKIGVMDIESKHNLRKWTKDEIALAEAAADRTALTLENARLLDDSKQRANRERAIGDMSTKITTTTDTETILRTAVRELGWQIGDAKVSIEINPEGEQE